MHPVNLRFWNLQEPRYITVLFTPDIYCLVTERHSVQTTTHLQVPSSTVVADGEDSGLGVDIVFSHLVNVTVSWHTAYKQRHICRCRHRLLWQAVRILVLVLILSSLILLTSLFHDKRTACGGIWFSDLWTTVCRICPVTLRRVMRLCRAACLARCAVCCGWYTGSLDVSYIVLCCSVKHDNRVDGCFFQHLCEHISYVSMLRMAYKE